MKVVLQEQKEADTKSSKLESASTAMKAKSEVPKEKTSEGDGHIRNESNMLPIRTRVTKKPCWYDNYIM